MGAFFVSLSIITLFTSGWVISWKALPQVLSNEHVLAVQGTIYYVAPDGNDSNPGTESLPWRTIQKAANNMVAGDTVFIRAWTY